MDERDIFDALRREGIDADDPIVRKAVRTVIDHVEGLRDREGAETARLAIRTMYRTLAYQVQHPDVGDMEGFEAQFGDDPGAPDGPDGEGDPQDR